MAIPFLMRKGYKVAEAHRLRDEVSRRESPLSHGCAVPALPKGRALGIRFFESIKKLSLSKQRKLPL